MVVCVAVRMWVGGRVCACVCVAVCVVVCMWVDGCVYGCGYGCVCMVVGMAVCVWAPLCPHGPGLDPEDRQLVWDALAHMKSTAMVSRAPPLSILHV